MSHRLSPLLEPESICFIGASNNAGRIGGMPIALLAQHGFQGQVFPVNPKYDEVFGYPCFPDVEALPGAPDLAVLAISAGAVLPMLRRCHAKGIGAAIVYAAGFAEEGEAGRALQRDVEDFARATGMVVAGPNCMGMANLNIQAHTAFASVFNAVPMQQGRGNVSLVTQSGNVCSAVYALVRELGLPVSHFINTGNEACVEFSEYLEYLADDPDTEVVVGYIEQLRNGPRFLQACARLRERGKVLIALKAGSTEKGAAAARSHTSALAGDQRVYRCVFEKYGVIEANDFTQVALLAELAQLRHRAGGRRVAVITISGALGAILADRFIEAGLDLPELSPDVQRVLRQGIPDYGMVSNPVDVTGNVVNQPGVVHSVLEALATSDALDAIVIYAPGYMLDRMADSIAAVAEKHNRFIAAIDTGRAACRQRLRDAGVAVFHDLGQAVSSLAPFLLWQEGRKRPLLSPLSPSVAATTALRGLNEAGALRYLASFGLPVKAERVATSLTQAQAHAEAAGYPVVLKVLSADIAHKTEAGGVVLNITNADELAIAYQDLLGRVHAHAPDARIDGVLVQSQERAGVDVIVGARRDPVFGPMITVGLGGVLTEIYRDTALALLPISIDEAIAMLKRLIAYPLLDGYRNTPKADVEATAHAICAIGQALLTAGPEVTDIEINPLRVRSRGEGVIALDALILTESKSQPALCEAN